MSHDHSTTMLNAGDLDGQFVSICRSFVKEGRLARLWAADTGLSASAAPVFWLLGRGYSHGLAVATERIAFLSGISKRAVARVTLNLAAEHVISPGFSVGAGQVRYALSRVNLWTVGNLGRKMQFPADIVSSGLWRSLRRSERSVLLALLSIIRLDDLDATISCSQLARLAGISTASAARALESLNTNTSVGGISPLSIMKRGQSGTDVALNDAWWRLWPE